MLGNELPIADTEAGPSQMLRSNLGSVVLTLKKLGIDDLVRPSRTYTPFYLKSCEKYAPLPSSHLQIKGSRNIHLTQFGAEPKNDQSYTELSVYVYSTP
jgi:hypothetical protein